MTELQTGARDAAQAADLLVTVAESLNERIERGGRASFILEDER